MLPKVFLIIARPPGGPGSTNAICHLIRLAVSGISLPFPSTKNPELENNSPSKRFAERNKNAKSYIRALIRGVVCRRHTTPIFVSVLNGKEQDLIQ